MRLNSEIAELCGAIIGDGWIESTEKALYITGHPTEDKEYFDNHLVHLFSKNFINVNPRSYDYWSVYGIHTYKKDIIRNFIRLGITKGYKANNIKFPDWIFSSKKFMISALRGLFDTDGCFSSQRCHGKYDNEFRKRYHCQPRLEINSISKKLIHQTFKITQELGLSSERIKRVKGGIRYNRSCSDVYKIRINKLNEIKLWFEHLNLSSNPKHTTKYYVWKKFGFCPANLKLEERNKILRGKISPYSYY